MRIAVLLKPVLIQQISYGKTTSEQNSSAQNYTLAGPDCAALNLATAFRKKYLVEDITVFSMTPECNLGLLEEVKRHGVDQICHICDSSFAGSDTISTARILAAAIEKKGPFDLVLAGRRSIDSETGQVPAQVAFNCGLPFLSDVHSLQLADGVLTAERELENQTQTVRMPMPCLISVRSVESALAVPSLAFMRKARSVTMEQLDREALQLTIDQTGNAGSQTRVVRLDWLTYKQREKRLIIDPAAGAACIYAAVQKAAVSRKQNMVQADRMFPPELQCMIVCSYGDRVGYQTALELTGFMAGYRVRPTVIVIGALGQTPEEIRQSGAAECLCISAPDTGDEVHFASVLAPHLVQAHLVLFPATVRMRSLASVCAAMTGSGLTADCTDLRCDETGRLLQIRPTNGGSRLAYICTKGLPAMATIRPHVLQGNGIEALPNWQFRVQKLDADPAQSITVCSCRQTGENQDAQCRKIVFSVGAGVTKVQAADIFAFGFAKAASRAAVNLHLAEPNDQVGQTGKTIRPGLYVAFGISGAPQHLAGMIEAETIISVNKDRFAPIFDYSDVAICADIEEVIKELKIIFGKEGCI